MWGARDVGARALACACARVALSMNRTAMLPTAASLAPPHFLILSHTRYDFCKKKKKGTEHKMGILIFSAPFVSNISHSKKNSDTVINVKTSSRKVFLD